MCEEKWIIRLRAASGSGSPPRMRGKVVERIHSLVLRGITPAYAGKSQIPEMHASRTRDHPRVCGEKPPILPVQALRVGSPPRMRGKAAYTAGSGSPRRITPAYAGKSIRCRFCVRAIEDHPRVCGEKPLRSAEQMLPEGSPPRMRGKAQPSADEVIARRITPAYAGKSHHAPRS